mmetsp:Transcript_91493/g.258664  ORF Transcript_91493/g.258664 Transcript_91493/m.258664 type:complete len:202 (-) Transcript_91493:2709-3314(-)
MRSSRLAAVTTLAAPETPLAAPRLQGRSLGICSGGCSAAATSSAAGGAVALARSSSIGSTEGPQAGGSGGAGGASDSSSGGTSAGAAASLGSAASGSCSGGTSAGSAAQPGARVAGGLASGTASASRAALAKSSIVSAMARPLVPLDGSVAEAGRDTWMGVVSPSLRQPSQAWSAIHSAMSWQTSVAPPSAGSMDSKMVLG